MGYIFQKLFGDDRKSYRLEIEKYHYTIWLWVIGKTIHVNDWYDHTYDVIEFYKANKDDSIFSDKNYIRIALNRQTGEVFLNNRWEEFDRLMKSSDENVLKLKDKYKDTSEIYLYKDKMDKVIIELEKLNPITH